MRQRRIFSVCLEFAFFFAGMPPARAQQARQLAIRVVNAQSKTELPVANGR